MADAAICCTGLKRWDCPEMCIRDRYASAFAMFAELGTFYEEHGYFGMGHSRMRRAEILLEFAKERKPGLLPVLGEGLDVYKRQASCRSVQFS